MIRLRYATTLGFRLDDNDQFKEDSVMTFVWLNSKPRADGFERKKDAFLN